MISYIYLLLITTICYLWQGIAKEQVDFFKLASKNNSVNMKYDYLYTAIVNVRTLCNNGGCKSGIRVNLPNYKYSHEAKVCEDNGTYYAFYTDSILKEKPPVSLSDNSELSLISVKDIPVVCKNNSDSNSNEDDYALKKS
ncbi:hypothetical protein KBS16_004856 [Escherichia coli]|nr:hypothetical protein [Escherichia coli]EHJ6103039.1 hypothetical protein [Escherichia coli]